jgi:peptidoglycan hydrolase CwlO-like protein
VHQYYRTPVPLQDVVVKVEKMNANLDERLKAVVQLEEEIKAKERRILNKEEEILSQGDVIADQLHVLVDKVESV